MTENEPLRVRHQQELLFLGAGGQGFFPNVTSITLR
jgi:hypothetical protein